MKTYLSLIVLFIVFLTACTSQKDASVAYDDVYYSSQAEISVKRDADDAIYTANEVVSSSEYIESNTSDDYNYGGDNTYSVSEYSDEEFEMDEYYDYSYTARIRRFHDPNPGYSYYDNYYTNKILPLLRIHYIFSFRTFFTPHRTY